jgi:flavin reductase (DIM6/NTAB) family NADH-FMN oxidoreductase RutF
LGTHSGHARWIDNRAELAETQAGLILATTHKAEIFVQDNPVDPAAFRQAMGLFATGVGIVSLAKPDGSPRGVTANSIVSVSLEPMLVSWSIQNGSSQFDAYATADQFAISILNADQRDLALRYAARGDTQTRAEDFDWTARGLPVIAGAVGTIECRRWSAYPAGDHTMIFGEVMGISASDGIDPLGFFGGRFCRIAD